MKRNSSNYILSETCNIHVKVSNTKHVTSLGHIEKTNSNSKLKTKSKNEETSEIGKATKIEKIEKAANTDCPFTLPQSLTQTFLIQIKSFGPEFA